MTKADLKSSISRLGKYVTQVTGFVGGEKKTWRGVDTSTIEQSEFTKFVVRDGFTVNIKTSNVLWFESHSESLNVDEFVIFKPNEEPLPPKIKKKTKSKKSFLDRQKSRSEEKEFTVGHSSLKEDEDMKTVSSLFIDYLPMDYRILALQNLKKEAMKEKSPNIRMALLHICPRENTPEGKDFWRDVYNYFGGKNTDLPKIPQKDTKE